LLEELFSTLKSNTEKTQFVLFSATVDQATIDNVATYINEPAPIMYKADLEAIKLQNVKQYKMHANEKVRKAFLDKFYSGFDIPASQAMIFT
jgi:superfamily II DNA/RNA helicase